MGCGYRSEHERGLYLLTGRSALYAKSNREEL